MRNLPFPLYTTQKLAGCYLWKWKGRNSEAQTLLKNLPSQANNERAWERLQCPSWRPKTVQSSHSYPPLVNTTRKLKCPSESNYKKEFPKLADSSWLEQALWHFLCWPEEWAGSMWASQRPTSFPGQASRLWLSKKNMSFREWNVTDKLLFAKDRPSLLKEP